jgi:U4/U6.U5 tri-snRNP component SNU23
MATAAGGAGVGPSRRKWDVEQYTQKARERDREERERAEENEERARKGLKPVKRKWREELPTPTQTLQSRERDLELSKNEGKTLIVENTSSGGVRKGGAGFHCETCNRTFKDSIAYLDHVNGRLHLRKIGQTTQVARSTLDQVRARLVYWQEELKQRSAGAREYDFERRLAEIAREQMAEKQQRKLKKQAAKDARKASTTEAADAEAMAMMGFGSFGSSKRG